MGRVGRGPIPTDVLCQVQNSDLQMREFLSTYLTRGPMGWAASQQAMTRCIEDGGLKSSGVLLIFWLADIC